MYSSNDVFLVTGASSGIGQAVALRLSEEGGTVIAIGRSMTSLEITKELSRHPSTFFCEKKDLVEEIEDLPSYILFLTKKYGKIRGVANCAGVTEILPLRALDLCEMKKIFDINYYAPIFLAKAFVNKRVNIGTGSSFVSVASIACEYQVKGVISYSGTKAALVASMRSIAKEYAEKGIRFNCVSPSDIDTPMTRDIPEIMDKVRNSYPLGFGKPKDVASMVCFLLSKETEWITGQNYIIDCASR